jgi:BCD family chlorophyll transporter-like MFS transporter
MMATQFWAGLALAVVAFLVIGGGVGACGTALLVLLSKSVAQTRLAAAATVTWVMMIVGFIVTTILAAKMLEPFSLTRLVEMTAVVAAAAFLVTVIATRGIESSVARPIPGMAPLRRDDTGFREALRAVWRESHSRRLTSFVFISMLAYSAQDLILEPFAGAVFGLSPAESTRLSGLMSSGTLIGMILVAFVCTVGAKAKVGRLRLWTIGGCIASASMLLTLAVSGFVGPAWPLHPTVFLLGLANGAYAVAAIGTMMGLVGRGRESREGTRMGLWGAAQAMAFAVGGLAATGLVDLARWAFESVPLAYAVVFVGEAALFVWATVFAVRLSREDTAGLVEVDLQERSAVYVTEAGRG